MKNRSQNSVSAQSVLPYVPYLLQKHDMQNTERSSSTSQQNACFQSMRPENLKFYLAKNVSIDLKFAYQSCLTKTTFTSIKLPCPSTPRATATHNGSLPSAVVLLRQTARWCGCIVRLKTARPCSRPPLLLHWMCVPSAFNEVPPIVPKAAVPRGFGLPLRAQG